MITVVTRQKIFFLILWEQMTWNLTGNSIIQYSHLPTLTSSEFLLFFFILVQLGTFARN